MQNRTGPWSAHIMPSGLFSPSVKLEIRLECEYNMKPRSQSKSRMLYVGSSVGWWEEMDHYWVSCITEHKRLVSSGQCGCTRNHQENSPDCSGRGALVCGQCECSEPYTGHQCQRDDDSFFAPNEDACRSGPNAPVCSGRGECIMGVCECHSRLNPEERYYGRFCECSNFECPRSNNR